MQTLGRLRLGTVVRLFMLPNPGRGEKILSLGIWSFAENGTGWDGLGRVPLRVESAKYIVFTGLGTALRVNRYCVGGGPRRANHKPRSATFCEIPVWFSNAPNRTDLNHSEPIRSKPDQNFFSSFHWRQVAPSCTKLHQTAPNCARIFPGQRVWLTHIYHINPPIPAYTTYFLPETSASIRVY